MAESTSHNRLKKVAAGKSGKIEKKLPSGKRLDAVTKKKATEVERSGSPKGLQLAAKRLKESRKKQKVLQVPQKDMGLAVKAMKKVGTTGTVKNIGSTKRISISRKKK